MTFSCRYLYQSQSWKCCRLAMLITFSGLPVFHSSSVWGAEITAFTEPYRDIDVAAQELGTLAELRVKEGDRVERGQVLAVLNNDVLQATLRTAEANAAARGRLNSATAELEMYAERVEKLRGLRERGHASQLELDRAVAQWEVAQANLETVRDELAVRVSEVERIQAQIRSRQLIAPLAGVVTEIFKDEGEFVSTADPAVIKVVQLDPLLVVFSAPGAVQQELQVGSSVTLLCGTDRTEVPGTVEFISPTVDGQSGTVRLKIKLANSQGKIKSGTVCRLNVAGELPSSIDSPTLTEDSLSTLPVSEEP